MGVEDASPLGCTWDRYLAQLTAEHGGWTAVVDLLIRRAGGAVALPEDPGSIERALRRLRRKGNAPGGQYGRWLVRYFGVPRPLDETARWMGQYHGRFAELPRSVCEEQLRLWDRPPIAQSPAACWIQLGLAASALRRRDRDEAARQLARVRSEGLPAAARAEALLLRARLASDTGGDVAAILDEAAACIASIAPGEDHDCYHARCVDQRAYRLLHGGGAVPAAARLYRSIASGSAAPFARFRRDHGLAYCYWRLGARERAARHAADAAEHAGDAGLLRFRAMALRLLAHIEPRRARGLRARADRIARALEHDDLR
jgi:hypothetical protein